MLIDQYLSRAIEVDVDALCDGETVFVAGVMEHIEEAGVHSGDSRLLAAAATRSTPETIAELKRQTEAMAFALNVRGLMNVQFAIEEPHRTPAIFVLEVNPRASRTVPFVAKTIGQPVAAIAAKIMAGEPLASFGLKPTALDHIAVKEAVFPFARFPGVDTVLGPEMRSTGEVMGLDWRRPARPGPAFARAFAKSQLGGGTRAAQGRLRVRLGQGRRQARSSWSRRGCWPRRLPDHRHRRHLRAILAEQGVPAERSRRCWKAGRTSSTR